MADRFPLIVNDSSRKIEEMISGDNLDLTSNGIAINGSTGVSGQYLKSDGGVVAWGDPGDVFLTASQTVTNKTFETCIISGSTNTITNIPNTALINSTITVNGTSIPLGGSVITPDENTTYSLSAVDGTTAADKVIRLTDSGAVETDVTISVGNPQSVSAGYKALDLSIARSGDQITFSGVVEDSDTVTTLQTFTGGTPQTGAMILKASGGITLTQDAPNKTITIDSRNDDTITQLKVGSGGTYASGNWTILPGTEVTLSESTDGNGDPTVTINSVDTITRLQGGGSGTLVSGDVQISGGSGGNVTVSQSGNTIEIDSQNDDTITRLASTASNGTFALASGDFRLTASGDAELTQTTASGVTTIDIGFTNTDTGAGLGADAGIVLNGSDFELKNAGSLTDQALLKWDSANAQLVNSVINDNGTDVTINGNLNVAGTTTTLDSTVMRIADPIIELRKGASLSGADGGIQVNRTTQADGQVLTWTQLQWYETGGYWRTFNNGGVARRLVTENETQTLTNKTLNDVTLTGTGALGTVTASTINGLIIDTTIGGELDVANQKKLSINSTLTLSGTDGASINFGSGGGAGASVAYTSNSLAAFSSTTSTEFRGVITDETGIGSLVFADSPTFQNGINSGTASINVFDTTATTVSAFGDATVITIGQTTGKTTINHELLVKGNVEFGDDVADVFLVNGQPNFENNDIVIRGTDTNPMTIGRGNSAVLSNTAIGVEVLSANQGGSQNTAIGYQALAANVSGLGNCALGDGALRNCDVGENNSAMGKDVMLSLEGGDNNVAIGNSAMYGNIGGDNNVCIGAFAGYNMSGSGNVLIGSSADAGVNGKTYTPPSSAGDNQLVIASGTNAWIFGDNSFNISLPNDLTVGGNTTIEGNLVVNGTTTSLNVQTIQIDDNAIELAAVSTAQFSGNITDASSTITNINDMTGIAIGMDISVISGAALPANTTILTVDVGTSSIGLSAPVSGAAGVATFSATGPTDLAANNGGLILQGGTSNKTILYDHTRTDKYWVFSENLEIKSGKKISIGNTLLIDGTSLGTTVVNSSLTSVGTLQTLGVSGAASFGGRIKESNDNSFATVLTPSSNVLTINTATSNTICGTPASAAINEWAFTNVNLGVGESLTLTVILNANTSALYGDACSIDGSSITNGVEWSGGSPPAPTNNTDILTFVIVKDGSGVVRVFGQGNTDFS